MPTVELQINKRRYILLGTFPLALAMVYVLEMPYIASPVWLKWFMAVLLGGDGIWVLASVLIGHPYLKLTAYGIESQILFRTLKIRWLDIAIIRAYERKGARFLGFNYVQGRVPKNALLYGKFFGYHDSFANSSTLKFEKFCYLVFSYWEHAKQVHELELSKQASNPRLKVD